MNVHSSVFCSAAMVIACAAPGFADTPPAPVTVSVQPTGLQTVLGVSRTGRYILGAPKDYGRVQLRDLTRDVRIKRLPRAAERPSLSTTGRYVAYTLPIGEWGRHKVMVYDRRTGRTTNVTRRSNGSILRPSWRSSCTQATCEEDQKLVYAPQLAGGQISGNGRYVGFCANFRKPARIDLYLKNLRTQRLRTFKGACRPVISNGDSEAVQAPSLSDTARTILIPGRLESNEAGNTWEPGRALFGRSRLIEIGGVGNSTTHDGRTVTINGAFAGSDEGVPVGVAWYDVASETSSPADPSALRLNLQNCSFDGRYVLWRSNVDWSLQIRDRTLGTDYDLQAALVAEGLIVDTRAGSAGNAFIWGHPDVMSALSSDGQVAFVRTDAGIVAAAWSP